MAFFLSKLSRRPPWAPWAALNVVGFVLIALPDPDQRVLSFSRTHGPGPADLAGSILLTSAWVLLDVFTWRHRQALAGLGARRLVLFFLMPALAGIGLVAWSVSQDAGMWWLAGAGILALLQLTAARAAVRAGGRPNIAGWAPSDASPSL
ncbi:MAG TPA: hypothetical protein VHJ78_10240 [Actinomycetota bacterium]|nr:hypothetical protein [Actinomycetota bacterium]